MRNERVLSLIAGHMDEIRERFGVSDLSLFGSLARGEGKETSDIDILVDFAGAADFKRFMGLKFFLEDLLGRPVDLATSKALRPEMRERIESEAVHVA